MPTPDERRPAHEFPEGITILIDSAGLEIRVDDYHARPLTLPWATIEAMRREARAVPHRGGATSIGQ